MHCLIVSIDSLRLDYVSPTNRHIKTPRFDDLTRDFCFYSGLFSASTATRPVHTSLFTGLYPFEHGVLSQRTPSARPGFSHLFELLQRAGANVFGFSEAHQLFTGLPFAPYIGPFQPAALTRSLRPTSHRPHCVFLHYWGAHTPYGARDGSALGETAQLLRTGQLHVIKERYMRAIEHIFERRLVSVLEAIDLREWSVFIFSDHGESWTPEEPYHGYTLRNSVLRVPLYYHIPSTNNLPPSRSVASLIDLYPTILNLFETESTHPTFAVDLRGDTDPNPYKLAQIHPDPMPNDLAPPKGFARLHSPTTGRQWALFNPACKYTYDEDSAEGRLEHTLSEERLQRDELSHAHFEGEFARLQNLSPLAKGPVGQAEEGDAALLDQRLRDLGYLD